MTKLENKEEAGWKSAHIRFRLVFIAYGNKKEYKEKEYLICAPFKS